jgi:hypothetical protein
MSKAIQIVLRCLPALIMMFIIFLFSAQSSADLPKFDWADRIVKKGGHLLGYAILAIFYWRVFDFRNGKQRLSWGFAILYAVTDEFHQSFVPGRYPSMWDVLIFDNLGALMGLWFLSLYKTQRSDSPGPIVEKINTKG